jgi:hypothetical protein
MQLLSRVRHDGNTLLAAPTCRSPCNCFHGVRHDGITLLASCRQHVELEATAVMESDMMTSRCLRHVANMSASMQLMSWSQTGWQWHNAACVMSPTCRPTCNCCHGVRHDGITLLASCRQHVGLNATAVMSPTCWHHAACVMSPSMQLLSWSPTCWQWHHDDCVMSPTCRPPWNCCHGVRHDGNGITLLASCRQHVGLHATAVMSPT